MSRPGFRFLTPKENPAAIDGAALLGALGWTVLLGISLGWMPDLLAEATASWVRPLPVQLALWLGGLGAMAFGRRVLIRELARRELTARNLESTLLATQTILDNIPFAIVIVGKDKMVRQVNHIAEEILGKPAREIVGRVCHQNICPALENGCPILDLYQTVDHSEKEVLGPEGRLIPVYKFVLPIFWKGEEVLLETFIDLTEHQQVAAKQKALQVPVLAGEQLIGMLHEKRLNRLSTGRELRMMQLKEQVNSLLKELGRGPQYWQLDADPVGSNPGEAAP